MGRTGASQSLLYDENATAWRSRATPYIVGTGLAPVLPPLQTFASSSLLFTLILSSTLQICLEPLFHHISKVKRVLDIGCGAGAWVHDVAQHNPHMQVVGIDTNTSFIEHAQKLAYNIHNATFLRQDMHTLEGVFQHGSFDLIHLRFLAGTVSVTQFPHLIQSVLRPCKRNGLLIMTEAELPLTCSTACDYMASLLLSSMIKAGMAFSPGFTPQLGIASRIRYWLRAQHCILKHDDTCYLDISHGKPAHNTFM